MSGDSFATQFYNLQGIHFNERKKNFNKLLQSADQELLEKAEIKPRTHLEHLFYIDVLIKARKVELLIQILKDGNPEFTSRILKQKWFFQEAFKDKDEQHIVRTFLPSLSYSLRMKVLKKMALIFSEERMDKLFDCILERYGLFVAQQFLFSCSSEKIIDTLKNNSLTLTVEQLKRFLQKDSELIKVYFNEFKKNTGRNYDDYDFIIYVVWKHPELYFELSKMLDKNIKIGRHTTKTVLKCNEKDSMADLKFIDQKFHIGVVTRKVKDFDKHILPKMFPKNINDLEHYPVSYNIQKYINKYPKKKRFEIFLNCFNQKYQMQLYDNLDKLHKKFVLFFSDQVDFVQKWGEIMFKKTDDLMYIQYLKPELAFNTVKERMNFTSDKSDRATLLGDLIKSCYFAKDYSFYKKSLSFLCYRSRNEDSNTRSKYLSTIEHKIDIDLTDDDFWKLINEMVEVSRTKKQSLPFVIMAKFLIYNFRKGRPVEELIAQYLADVFDEHDWRHYSTILNFHPEPKLHSLVLKYLGKNCLNLTKKGSIEREEDKSMINHFLERIITFNDNPKNKDWNVDLNECEHIKQHVQQTFSTQSMSDGAVLIGETIIKRNYLKRDKQPVVPDWYTESAVSKTFISWLGNKKLCSRLQNIAFELMKPPRTSQLQKDVLDFYFTRAFNTDSEFYNTRDVVRYFVYNEPEVIVKYFQRILSMEYQKPTTIDYSAFKLYGHLNWDRVLIELVKPLTVIDVEDNKRHSVLINLSKLMKTDEYIKLVTPYIPDKPKLDLQDEQQKKIFETQNVVVNKGLINLSDNYHNLVPVLSQFCQGDYLQTALPVLYKTLYRISELNAGDFIKVLMDRAVSTRKHAICLGFETLAQNTALDIFKAMSEKEDNVSAKKYLMQGVLKYFIKNPSDRLLTMVVKSLSYVNKSDKELLEYLSKAAENVIGKLRPMFCEKVFHFFNDMYKQEGDAIEPYITDLVRIMKSQENDFYLNLSEDFCINILQNYFLHDLPYCEILTEFAAKYLWAYNDELHFDVVFKYVKNWKELYWNSNEKQKLKSIFHFFSNVFEKFLHQDWDFLNMFKTKWTNNFTSEETPKEHVLIEMLIIFKKYPDLHEFARELNANLIQTKNRYGVYFINSLKEIFYFFFHLNDAVESHPTINLSSVALELLRIEVTELNALLAVEYFENTRAKDRNEIFEILKSVDEPFYRVKCNEFIKYYF